MCSAIPESFSTTGCSDTSYQTVSINPELTLDIVANPDSGCSPLTVNFPQSAADGAVVWFWDFGDGFNSNLQAASHTYINNTVNTLQFDVSLLAMNAFGCTDSIFTTITVYPNPLSQMNASPTIGCALLEVEFENISTGAVDFIWPTYVILLHSRKNASGALLCCLFWGIKDWKRDYLKVQIGLYN